MMIPICLWTILILLSLGAGYESEVVEVTQAAFAAGEVGKSVRLHCQFLCSQERISRQFLYWYISQPKKEELVVYPEAMQTYKGRVQSVDVLGSRDKSLHISDLRLSDTNLYYCMMSIVVDEKDIILKGNGTLLFVYGAFILEMERNNSMLQCRVQVWRPEEAQIIWSLKNQEMPLLSSSTSETREDGGWHQIRSWLNLSSVSVQPGHNLTFYCLLRHSSGGDVINSSIQVPGMDTPESDLPEPILLYVLLLMNPLLILGLVLLIFWQRH